MVLAYWILLLERYLAEVKHRAKKYKSNLIDFLPTLVHARKIQPEMGMDGPKQKLLMVPARACQIIHLAASRPV